MKTVRASMARSTAVEPAIIEIGYELPEFTSMNDHSKFMQAQAVSIFTALASTLPQGIFDRLLVEMMKASVSQLVVPFK